LKDLELSGIKPSEVIYMAYGIEIIAATPENEGGVKPNFTMCNGDELLTELLSGVMEINILPVGRCLLYEKDPA
jgi:hypothetical protein